ncbi:hypothetical protein N665_0190s0044 [Sinapis alba]|nr:hypothetical protein N665_0190s0044 [Sinapis alba]
MIMEHDKDLILENHSLEQETKLYNGLKSYIIEYFKLAYKRVSSRYDCSSKRNNVGDPILMMIVKL